MTLTIAVDDVTLSCATADAKLEIPLDTPIADTGMLAFSANDMVVTVHYIDMIDTSHL
jgi:hypothetical protein